MNDLRRNEYLALLSQIAGLERRKNKLDKEQRQYRERLQVIDSKLILEIGLAKNEKGKPIYSNEHLRRAKLVVKREEDEDFLKLQKRYREIGEKIDEIIVDSNNLAGQKYLLMIELGIPFNAEGEQYPDLQ